MPDAMDDDHLGRLLKNDAMTSKESCLTTETALPQPGGDGGIGAGVVSAMLARRDRFALLERAATAYLARLEQEKRDRRDQEIINRNAARLNREAVDTLEYQKLP
ncbi:MAG: hypothetical protein FJW20_09070 [Acidimicrobiia bacterium]|nr:hypothetical protein [Acidimicrobiia bacterium]